MRVNEDQWPNGLLGKKRRVECEVDSGARNISKVGEHYRAKDIIHEVNHGVEKESERALPEFMKCNKDMIEK